MDLLSYFGKSLIKISNNVVNMLNTDWKTYRCGGYVLLGQFLGGHLRVCGGVRMYHKALYIGHIGQQWEYLQWINELPCILLGTVDLECKDRSSTVREILLVEFMIRMIAVSSFFSSLKKFLIPIFFIQNKKYTGIYFYLISIKYNIYI